jgi:uncharacterized protein (DUF1015 family)
MVRIKAFKPYILKEDQADIVSLPYDVFTHASAQKEIAGKPEHFLRIDKPEVNAMQTLRSNMKAVLKLYKRNLRLHYHKEVVPSLYRYDLITESHHQKGLVALCSLEDLFEHHIRDHEETRKDKELERTGHIKTLNAQTGPIYLFHHNQAELRRLIESSCHDLVLEFKQKDVLHRIYALQDPERVEEIILKFSEVDHIYVADGHHRMNAARNVYLERMKKKQVIGNSDHFLAVVFPAEELQIYDYNRVVKDLNGLSAQQFIEALNQVCTIIETSKSMLKPQAKQEFTMYLDEFWYRYQFKVNTTKNLRTDEYLDVALLQSSVLSPILGIKQPRIDARIDFIGGVFGLDALVQRCHSDMRIGFALYPTAIEDLMKLSDLGMKMPPKSTWFEPKLLSGIWLCDLDE